MNVFNINVFNCAITILALTTFTCSQSSGQNENVEQQKKTYNGAQVFRVKMKKSSEIAKKLIDKMANKHLVDVWLSRSASVDVMVKKAHLDTVKNVINNQSLTFKVLIDDVQRVIDTERSMSNKHKRHARQGRNLTFDYFYDFHEINEYIDQLSREHSDRVEVITIGKSFEGVPLKVVIIKADENIKTRGAIWIDGGIHGREWSSVSSILYVIDRLVRDRNSLDAHMKYTEYHILPILNPDGYKYSHETDRLWRKNRRTFGSGTSCVGTDLNRNFDVYWDNYGSDKDPCGACYRGPEVASEMETRAMTEYLEIYRRISNAKVFCSLSFHSYGRYVFMPWKHTQNHTKDYQDLYRVGKRIAAAINNATSSVYKVGTTPDVINYVKTGTSLDWMKGVANIKYSYVVKLGDNDNHGFLLSSSEIIPSGKEAFAAVSTLAREIETAIKINRYMRN